MIYTAVLVACVVASPAQADTHSSVALDAATLSTQCRTHEMLINAGPSPVAAFIEAQNQAVEWLQHHPGLTKRSLTIRPGRTA